MLLAKTVLGSGQDSCLSAGICAAVAPAYKQWDRAVDMLWDMVL